MPRSTWSGPRKAGGAGVTLVPATATTVRSLLHQSLALPAPVLQGVLPVLVALICLVGQASAGHGGVVQLNRAAAGPYALSVWTQPAPPRLAPGAWTSP